jgi:hypothetical protein
LPLDPSVGAKLTNINPGAVERIPVENLAVSSYYLKRNPSFFWAHSDSRKHLSNIGHRFRAGWAILTKSQELEKGENIWSSKKNFTSLKNAKARRGGTSKRPVWLLADPN